MDWNNDGKTDLIAGDTKGNVTVFLNTGSRSKPELAKGKLVKADGKAIEAKAFKDADTYSKLHMADWNDDGLKDLLIGHSSTIVMYKNVGTESEPRFEAPTQIKLSQGNYPSRPSPFVIDWDKDGKKDLLIGSDGSKIYFSKNVGTNRKPKLAKPEEVKLPGPKGREIGYRLRIDVTDWNDDGKQDLLVGNFYSGSGRKNGGNVWLFLGE